MPAANHPWGRGEPWWGVHVEGDTCGTTHRAQMVGGGKTPCTKGA